MSRRKPKHNPAAVMPDALLARLNEILGTEGFEAWRDGARPGDVAARVNTLRGSAAAVLTALRQSGLTVVPVPWCAEAFTVPAAQRSALTASEPVNDGRAYVQNLASMLPPLLLDVGPGMEVLDLAAAPGSKTLQLAGLMRDSGRLAAVERSKPRFHKLKANCRRAGASCVQFYLKDGTRVGQLTPERFDRVLLDAPCSSEGRINMADPETAAYWSEKKIRQLAGLQKRLLASALQALKPGGLLVYSTCTFAPEENEAVVDWLLSRYSGFVEPEPVEPPVTNVRRGMTQWRGQTFAESVRHTIRILPEEAMEGFYIAVLKKTASLR